MNASPAATPVPLTLHPGVSVLVDRLLADAPALGLGVRTTPEGTTLIDAGIAVRGGLEAGRRITELCMGGFGHVSFTAQTAAVPDPARAAWRYDIVVQSSQPVLACLASQYAGWALSHGTGKGKFMAMGSGPARALAAREPLFAELGVQERAARSVLVLEVDREPPPEVLAKVCRDCGLEPSGLTVVLTPTTSLAGMTQIVGRVLEVALHKAHTLHFPLDAIVDGVASAPLPPPSGDFLASMGRSNDAILFGGHVHLFVRGPEAAAEALAAQLPSSASADYGRPFAEVFKAVGYDFYRIDPLLFAPAQAMVTCLETGRSFAAGRRDDALLDQAFGARQVPVQVPARQA